MTKYPKAHMYFNDDGNVVVVISETGKEKVFDDEYEALVYYNKVAF